MAVCSKCGAALNCPDHHDHAISGAQPCEARKAEIWVNVVDHEGKPVKGVKVDAKGKKLETDDAGFIAFDNLDDGDYPVEVLESLLEGEPARKSATVKAGDVKFAKFKLEKPNDVTPKIECEYKVVLLDRKLSDHQTGEPEGDKLVAEPTYILLSIEQTNAEKYPFKGTGKLEFDKPNVEAFLDDKCTKKVEKEFTAEELSGKDKVKVWLKGKTAGKFEAKLTLTDPEPTKFVKLAEDPAKAEMGTVEIKMILHQQDFTEIDKIEIDPDAGTMDEYYTKLKDQEWPKQKALSDEDKVKKGRLLHKQKDGNHGRALLRIEKLDAGQWPDGTDDYEIYVNRTNKSGAVDIYDKEFEGTKQKIPTGPFKVKDLKAKEQDLWVEGTTETEKLRDIMLDLALDRPEGGLQSDPKRYADWGRVSVVCIKEVKLNYKAAAGAASAHDEAQHRFYINFKKDGDGRKIKLQVELTKKIQDIVVHFMLAEHKDNRKSANWGEDLPDGTGDGTEWKWKDITKDVKHKDRDNRKKLRHVNEKTDGDGKAEKEVSLSQFGGDKFYLTAYIDEDAHLSRYIHGHTDLEKKKPVMAEHPLEVYRRFWYENIKVAGLNVAGYGTAADPYTRVKADMKATDEIEMTRVTADAIDPPVIYKKCQLSYYVNDAGTAYVNNFPGDESDGLCVGDGNRSEFFDLTKKTAEDKKKYPVKFPMVNVHGLWIPDGTTASQDYGPYAPADFPVTVTLSKKCLDPPLQGGDLLVAGTYEAGHDDGGWVSDASGNLAAGDVSIDSNRSDPREIQISLPAGAADPDVTEIYIDGLQIAGATSFLGTSYADGIVNSYTPNDVQDYYNTISHEVGHSLSQVTKARPGGVPAHALQYDQDGSHCNYQNKSCLMYESGPQAAALNRYCPVCHPYLLVQDMSLKVR